MVEVLLSGDGRSETKGADSAEVSMGGSMRRFLERSTKITIRIERSLFSGAL